jgi:hypothetical protein
MRWNSGDCSPLVGCDPGRRGQGLNIEDVVREGRVTILSVGPCALKEDSQPISVP